MTLAEIDARLTALKAIPPGTLSLSETFAGRTRQESFASVEDITAEIGRLEALREQVAGSTPARPRLWYLYGSRGV